MGTATEWVRRARRRFGPWRRGRPFTAGVLLVLASAAIAVPPYATFRLGDVVLVFGTIGGASALLIGALLMICGLSLWLRPEFRIAAGTTALLLSLVALAATNLGGFQIGTLLGVLGATLALAWTDRPLPPRRRGWEVFRRGAAVFGVLVVTSQVAPRASSVVEPARSWTLVASKLRMEGVVYHGIRRVVVDGRSVPTMRFTVAGLWMTEPVQTGSLGNGRDLVITAERGNASSPDGVIELSVLRLAGNLVLLGLVEIPVDFTPDRPPPLVPPVVVLTEAAALNAQLSGGTLAMEEARLTVG